MKISKETDDGFFRISIESIMLEVVEEVPVSAIEGLITELDALKTQLLNLLYDDEERKDPPRAH